MNGNSCHKSWITVGGLRAIKCLLTKCRAKAEDRRLGDNRWLGKKDGEVATRKPLMISRNPRCHR